MSKPKWLQSVERLRALLTDDDRRAMDEWLEKQKPTCTWTEDEYGMYQTGCGNAFVFNSDGPTANACEFCAYCGLPLIEKPYEEPEIEDEEASDGR